MSRIGQEGATQNQQVVRLLREGSYQILHIPRGLELPGAEALLRKEGERLIVEPMRQLSFLEVLSAWGPLDEKFPDIDDPKPVEGAPAAHQKRTRI